VIVGGLLPVFISLLLLWLEGAVGAGIWGTRLVGIAPSAVSVRGCSPQQPQYRIVKVILYYYLNSHNLGYLQIGISPQR
jgi:hypothetical protein